MFDGTGHRHTRTVVTSDGALNGESIVLACGYEGTDYGYFICTETERDGLFYYDNQLAFFKKVGELTFNEALKELDVIASANKR